MICITGNDFMSDVASWLNKIVQLTTDGLRAYLDVLENAFDNQIDFAQLLKIYGGVDYAQANVCLQSKVDQFLHPSINMSIMVLLYIWMSYINY